MIDSGEIDAVVIATPHLSHTELGVRALQAGLHVMVEKPISAHKADAERLLAAHTDGRQVVAAMFNVRTRPYMRKVHELLQAGELGELRRVNWTATAFFRTHAYFDKSAWRGTWEGEGGGVLVNQAPHHLDLLQWFCGMPSRVRGFCGFGKYHDIEVEDEVTAYLEFPNGATGIFVTSTGEAPGTTRIEIAGELGRIVIENEKVSFSRNAEPMSEFGRRDADPMGSPAVEHMIIEAPAKSGNYVEMFQNFIDAILDGVPLIAPAEEGLQSLELANAILLSSLQDRAVDLPLDGSAYEAELKKLVATRR
jgi:predicted dehydrogenase